MSVFPQFAVKHSTYLYLWWCYATYKNWIKSLEMFSVMNINTGVELSGHQNGQKWPGLPGQGQRVLDWRVISILFFSFWFFLTVTFIIKSWSWHKEPDSISNVASSSWSFHCSWKTPNVSCDFCSSKVQLSSTKLLVQCYGEFNLAAYRHKTGLFIMFDYKI